jgi:alcohol dehydrogenase class IV
MWNFSCPLIVYGDNSLDYLAQVKGKKAFIVTDKNIVKLGLINSMKQKSNGKYLMT